MNKHKKRQAFFEKLAFTGRVITLSRKKKEILRTRIFESINQKENFQKSK